MKQNEIKKYLDTEITKSREKHNRARTPANRKLLVVRMDALQDVRYAVFGERLPKDKS